MLLNNNFLHTTIAILHDIQALGWSRQSLTIYKIAREFLGIGRGCYLIYAGRIIFYNIPKISPYISKEIILLRT